MVCVWGGQIQSFAAEAAGTQIHTATELQKASAQLYITPEGVQGSQKQLKIAKAKHTRTSHTRLTSFVVTSLKVATEKVNKLSRSHLQV